MGFTPIEIRSMSLWEFHQTVEGFRRFSSPDDADEAQAPDEDEFFATLERLAD